MAARIFAVLAAVFLVGAIAVASVAEFGQTLAGTIYMLDNKMLEALRNGSPAWLWNWIELPFLQRPIWLIPACLGVICAGIAMTLNMGKATPSRRKRS